MQCQHINLMDKRMVATISRACDTHLFFALSRAAPAATHGSRIAHKWPLTGSDAVASPLHGVGLAVAVAVELAEVELADVLVEVVSNYSQSGLSLPVSELSGLLEFSSPSAQVSASSSSASDIVAAALIGWHDSSSIASVVSKRCSPTCGLLSLHLPHAGGSLCFCCVDRAGAPLVR